MEHYGVPVAGTPRLMRDVGRQRNEQPIEHQQMEKATRR